MRPLVSVAGWNVRLTWRRRNEEKRGLRPVRSQGIASGLKRWREVACYSLRTRAPTHLPICRSYRFPDRSAMFSILQRRHWWYSMSLRPMAYCWREIHNLVVRCVCVWLRDCALKTGSRRMNGIQKPRNSFLKPIELIFYPVFS